MYQKGKGLPDVNTTPSNVCGNQNIFLSIFQTIQRKFSAIQENIVQKYINTFVCLYEICFNSRDVMCCNISQASLQASRMFGQQSSGKHKALVLGRVHRFKNAIEHQVNVK